jgi:Flp pilus assembly secretin CpaC
MTDFFAPAQRRNLLKFWVTCMLAAAVMTPAAFAADTIAVHVDEAKIARLPERASTIVVGNPLIADVSLQQGGLMVITGKGYGETNLIALDRGGTVLSEQAIQVKSPANHVVVLYRGLTQESYSCTPRCERRITLGDTPSYFDPTLNQTVNRTLRAQGVASSTVGGGAAGR